MHGACEVVYALSQWKKFKLVKRFIHVYTENWKNFQNINQVCDILCQMVVWTVYGTCAYSWFTLKYS